MGAAMTIKIEPGSLPSPNSQPCGFGFEQVSPRPSINNDQGYLPGNARWATKSERGRKHAGEILRDRGPYPVAGDD
jgi:hypothetical protein